jgi:hypothetical protein
LFFNFVLKVDDRGHTAFAKPNLSLQYKQQSDQGGWQ